MARSKKVAEPALEPAPEPEKVAGLTASEVASDPRWVAIAGEANRRRVRVEIRRGPDAHPLRAMGTNRGGVELERIGDFDTLEQTFGAFEAWLARQPLPGADALRSELRAFGRRRAIATPRDFAKKPGADVPLYRDFRDRILPLAWDNLVDATRVEALEDFVRRVGEAERGTEKGARNTLELLAAEARGLVAPKEDVGDAEHG